MHDRGYQRHGGIVGRFARACASARAVYSDGVADCITYSASAADRTCACANSRASACASTVSFAQTDEAIPALEECNQVMIQIATLAVDLADLAKQEQTRSRPWTHVRIHMGETPVRENDRRHDRSAPEEEDG